MSNSISKISAINQTVLESVNARDEKQIIKNFTDIAVKTLKADYGYSFVWDNHKNEFYLIYKDSKTPFISQTPRKSGVTAQTFKSKKPLYISQAATHGKIRSDAKKHMEGVVVIPISYRNQNYGTLDVCFIKSHTFTEEEKVLCSYIGNSAAQALTLYRFQNQLENLVATRTNQLRQTNLELQRDKASDDAVLASIGEGLIGTDKQGRVIFINPTAENILSIKKQAVMGKSLFKFQPLVDHNNKEVSEELRPTFRALSEGRRVTSSAYCYVKPNKKQIPIAITATPVMLKGQIIGSIQVFRDISEEREVDRVKTELISLASHQLRTPLSAINWYTEALIKEEIGKLHPEQKKYLQQVRSANQKMISMVYDFLNVSRIELGTFTVKFSSVDGEAIGKEITQELKPLIKEKHIKLTQAYGTRLKGLQTDQKILRVILQNLLTNAVKYTPNHGKIYLDIRVNKENILQIIVKDTGHGIPKNQQDKIFTKLFRADNASRLDAEGNGLGLYLVKSFVDLCQGKISFTSKENKGTTFTVRIPIKFSV